MNPSKLLIFILPTILAKSGLFSFFAKVFNFLSGSPAEPRKSVPPRKATPTTIETSATYSHELPNDVRPLRKYRRVATKKMDERAFKKYLRETGRGEDADNWDEEQQKIKEGLKKEEEHIEFRVGYYLEKLTERDQEKKAKYREIVDSYARRQNERNRNMGNPTKVY